MKKFIKSSISLLAVSTLSIGSALIAYDKPADNPAPVVGPHVAPDANVGLPFLMPAIIDGRLDLENRNLGDAGAIALGQYLHNHPIPGLTGLYLGRNHIGNAGIQALVQHLPAGLRILSLVENNIGAEGATALAHNLPARLESIQFFENDIGEGGAQALTDAGLVNGALNYWYRHVA